jgi:hypothetical protein
LRIACKKALRLGLKASFFEADVEVLPLADHSFDTAVDCLSGHTFLTRFNMSADKIAVMAGAGAHRSLE